MTRVANSIKAGYAFATIHEVPETIVRNKTLAEGTVDALKKAIADFKAQFKS